MGAAKMGMEKLFPPQGKGSVRLLDIVQGPHIQAIPGQGLQIGRKGAPGPGSAHAGHFAGTGATIADRADPAITF